MIVCEAFAERSRGKGGAITGHPQGGGETLAARARRARVVLATGLKGICTALEGDEAAIVERS